MVDGQVQGHAEGSAAKLSAFAPIIVTLPTVLLHHGTLAVVSHEAKSIQRGDGPHYGAESVRG